MNSGQLGEVSSIMLAAMAGAMVVFAGALYAVVFAIGKATENPNLVKLSYLFYGVLVVSVLVLARSLNFSGVWIWVAVTMLIGYLLAPHGIWTLCVGTHISNHESDDDQSDTDTSDLARRVTHE